MEAIDSRVSVTYFTFTWGICLWTGMRKINVV